MKEFSKIKFLQTHCLLNRKFNYETLKFEQNWPLRLRCYFVTFLEVTIPLKVAMGPLFERENEIQLWIGEFSERIKDSRKKVKTIFIL